MKELVLNNLLCFLSSGINDFANDVLYDITYTFYSIDEVNVAKTLLLDTLDKEISARNQPNKKKKDLNDVFDLFKELKSNDKYRRQMFVSDSYKKLPPVGMEFIAPLLNNLTNEVSKINNVLPKFVDIKSEVNNTADTVRNMSKQMTVFDKKLNSLNCKCATNKQTSIDVKSPSPLLGLRKPVTPTVPERCHQFTTPLNKSSSQANMEQCHSGTNPKDTSKKDENYDVSELNNLVENARLLHDNAHNIENSSSDTNDANKITIQRDESDDNDTADNDENKIRWTKVGEKKNLKKNNRIRTESFITGSNKTSNMGFKASTRTVDILLEGQT